MGKPPKDASVTKQAETDLARAEKGDRTALAAVRADFDKMEPAERAALAKVGDLSLQAQSAMLELLHGDHLVSRELVARNLAAMRADLAGPTPTALELLLVERIVACWLQVHHADSEARAPSGASFRQAEYLLKRQNAAHKRYLTALRTLAQVRRLHLVAVQVNIAEQQQVNVPKQSPLSPQG